MNFPSIRLHFAKAFIEAFLPSPCILFIQGVRKKAERFV